MPKNISKMTDKFSASLMQSVETLPLPKDLFKGVKLAYVPFPDNILLFVRNAGYDINRDRPNLFHSRNILLVPMRGSGRVVVNGKVFYLTPGHCMLIEPYQFHHYMDVETGNLCWLFITFDGHMGIVGGVRRIEDFAGFSADLQALVRAYQGAAQNPLQLVLRLSILLDAVRGIARRSARLESSRDESLLLRVHELTLANLAHPLGIAQMSAKLGLSESSFRSRFRKITGYSIGNFQQNLRLLEASKMLREGNATVAEAANACGWESPYSFSRAFSAYWGIPPKRFSMNAEPLALKR